MMNKKRIASVLAFIIAGTFMLLSCVSAGDITNSESAAISSSIIEEPEVSLTQEEIDLIALVTIAEAEGECEEGKRLVIDTILNRVDSKYFPDTVYDVVYQPYQFTSMNNGRSDRCTVTDEIRELVLDECMTRTNDEVVFFRGGRFSDYGVPLFKLGNHYFSKYE